MVYSSSIDQSDFSAELPNELTDLSMKSLQACGLCPRRCGVDRLSGKRGMCGGGSQVKLARAALHFWEEPPISGEKGSGTVFFSHCTLQCSYCQNQNISTGGTGQEISIKRLSEIFDELIAKGAHNINLVTPTHYVPHIIRAIDEARVKGIDVPMVYNTSGYELPETIQTLEGYIDIYLTDFKYFDDELGLRYSSASDYVENAMESLDRMVEQVGPPRYHVCEQKREEVPLRLMDSGVIVRHLLLPGQLEDAKRIVKYVLDRYGSDVVLSLMSQYTPLDFSSVPPELGRKVADDEYEALLDYVDSLGVEDYFWQEGEAAEESFIPAFDGTGV